jgi:uncharacterized phage protein gp47/JayE
VPFERPTLAALVERIRSDFRGRLSIVGPLLRRAMADVLGAVWAGGIHMLHGHLDWAAKQLFADTADDEYVLRAAAMYGISPTPATFAAGPVTATGLDGAIIPEDTILILDDVTYRVTAEAEVAAGIATLEVQAVLAGSDANAETGISLTFESPITDVDSEATVAAPGIAGGFEEENAEGVLDRLVLRLQEPPQGGADQDYEAWALAVAGVTRAWVFPHENGLGTVVVRFVLDDEETGEVVFPGAPEVAAVQAALEAQRPITAEVTAVAPTPLEVDFTIELTPDTTPVRAAVEAELADLLRREAEPGDGAGRGTIKLSRILTAIGVAEGVEDFELTVPSADVVPATGELSVMGDVTWI